MKKIIAISLCVILALCCMFACTSEKKPEPTAEPTTAPTSEPTAEPTATPEPTAAPTEDPNKVQKMDVDGIVTDMSEEIPVEAFKKSGADFRYEDGIYYASIIGSGATEGYISFRLYDPRYIEEGTGVYQNDAEPDDRTLADPAKHPFYAIKYRTSCETVSETNYAVCSYDYNVLSSPTDIIPYENHPLTCDGEWHTVIIDLKTECPAACGYCESGDAFDCLLFSIPAEEEEVIDIAWFGCFKSTEEITAWDANYSELSEGEVTVSE